MKSYDVCAYVYACVYVSVCMYVHVCVYMCVVCAYMCDVCMYVCYSEFLGEAADSVGQITDRCQLPHGL